MKLKQGHGEDENVLGGGVERRGAGGDQDKQQAREAQEDVSTICGGGQTLMLFPAKFQASPKGTATSSLLGHKMLG